MLVAVGVVAVVVEQKDPEHLSLMCVYSVAAGVNRLPAGKPTWRPDDGQPVQLESVELESGPSVQSNESAVQQYRRSCRLACQGCRVRILAFVDGSRFEAGGAPRCV